jgi:phosphatidylinositol 4-phosphatase
MAGIAETLLWQGFRLYTSPDTYAFEPKDQAGKSEILVIDRGDGEVKLTSSVPESATKGKALDVWGIIGIIQLHISKFLVVITSRKEIKVAGLAAPVYLATDFRLFPIPKDAKPSLLNHPIEKTLLNLLKTHLYSAPLYFSYGWDIGSSFQRQSQSNYEVKAALWKKTDERFFWNRFLQNQLISATEKPGGQDFSRFIMPIVFGFFETKLVTIGSRKFLFGLISRRSRHRAGTRYFSRGIDDKGNVSNFNESEQFVLADKAGNEEKDLVGQVRLSYLQTRGSVPVYWAEVNNLRYKPDLLIMDREETGESTALHFAQQTNLYGDNHLVNLVNQKGYEKPVKDAYERAIENIDNPKIHYTYYDFHHECKGMKFHNVIDLVKTLEDKGHSPKDAWFYYDVGQNKSLQKQQSVVRTNCMDCLDRTNVVQSTLAKCVVEHQLREVGIFGKGETLENHPDFWFIFRNVWADHADVISKAYSGTGALKTDFTRTGKRSKEGALQDGVNSVTRYVRNNFFDGSRQDAYDLFTGAWTPKKGVRGDSRALFIRALPYVWLFSLLVIFIAIFIPSLIDHAGQSKQILGFAIAIATITFYSITERGLQYVAWPTLNYPENVINYTGPGYASGRKGRTGSGKYASNSSKPQYTSANQTRSASSAAGRRGETYDKDE